MIRINLLPFRAARRKENVRRQIGVYFVLLILITGGMAYYSLMLGEKITALTNQINSTRTALMAKKKQATEVDRIQKKLETLRKKTEVIINLALGRKESVLLVDLMTEMIIEKRMWFSSLEEQNMAISIKGVALDNKTVADFMTRLEKSEFFENVRLQSTKKQKIGEYDNLKSFTVTLNKIPLSEIMKQKEEAEKS